MNLLLTTRKCTVYLPQLKQNVKAVIVFSPRFSLFFGRFSEFFCPISADLLSGAEPLFQYIGASTTE